MKSKRTVIGIIIGIIAAMLWSVVFINSLNSMAGIGIGICLGILHLQTQDIGHDALDDDLSGAAVDIAVDGGPECRVRRH